MEIKSPGTNSYNCNSAVNFQNKQQLNKEDVNE